MSTNSQAPKTGGRWKGRIYFINDTNKPNEVYDYSVMKTLVDLDENIIAKWKYTNLLSSWQLTSVFMNHKFILMRTASWFWSVEKNDTGIWIQKSIDMYDVLSKIGSYKRVEPTFLERSKGPFVTLRDLMEYIVKNELKIRYYYIDYDKNCQGFAERIYRFIKKPEDCH